MHEHFEFIQRRKVLKNARSFLLEKDFFPEIIRIRILFLLKLILGNV